MAISSFAVGLSADDVAIPNTFSPDTTIRSSDINENFSTLVAESNENDGRITDLENASQSLRPVWVDATDTVVGELWQEEKVIVKYPESSRIFSNLDFSDTISGQRFLGSDVFWSDVACSGTPYFQHYGVAGTLYYSQGVLRAGSTADGIAVFPDFDIQLTGGASDEVAKSRSYFEGDGSVTCSNQSFDYGSRIWVQGTVGTSSFDLGITLPVRLEWR